MSLTNLTALDIAAITTSWIQDNKDSFLFAQLPNCTALGASEGISSVTYRVGDLTNGLIDVGLQDWEQGQSAPEQVILSGTSVTFTCTGASTKEIARPLRRSAPHNLRDLEDNIVPILYSHIYQGIDKKLVSFLQSSAYGSQKTFTGSAALDAPSDHANQNPLNDMRINLQPLMKYRGGFLKLVCIMDNLVGGLLAGHPSFTGAGQGSNSPMMLPFEAVANIIKTRLGVDDVIISGTAINTARTGATPTIRQTANGLLWFGLVDTRTNMVVSQHQNEGPDGGLQIAFSRQPEVINYQRADREEDCFCGKVALSIFNPRSASANGYFGHFYKTNGNNGIFTSLPA